MATTRLHMVVDEIVRIAREAVPAGVAVLDGPSVGEVPPEALVVGLADGEPGYSASLERMPGAGSPRYRESWSVGCLLSVWSGDAVVSPVRARAASVLGRLDEALRVRDRADGLWDRVGVVGGTSWQAVQTPDGAMVTVEFAVEGESIL